MAYTRINWRNGEVALSDTNLNHMDQGIYDAHELINSLTSAGNALLLALHPVGDIIFNTSGINPSTYIGGTWVQWGKGRVPVGIDAEDTNFDTAEKEGGSADAIIPSHKHTFNGNVMPAHNHTQNAHNHTQNSHAHYSSKGSNYSFVTVERVGNVIQNDSGDTISGDSYKFVKTPAGGGFSYATGTSSVTPTNNGATATNIAASAGTPSGTISTEGVPVAGKNLQPYVTCYMWKRTA